MEPVALILAAWGALASVVWLIAGVAGLRAALTFRSVRDMAGPEPESWPRLTVVIAARDEARDLGDSLTGLLAQDYPNLEIVIVDDRSTDGTGAIVDAIASRDRRVRAVHVTDLPSDWLGKVHALRLGLRAATGDWLLFTDADVRFRPGALRRAVAVAVAEDIDHLAVAPEVVTPGFWLEVAASAFATIFMLGSRAVDVGLPGSRAYVGVGAFNLVRRGALDRTPGFEWLKMEVLDDVGLGLMIKRAGGRAGFAMGLGEISVVWYRSLAEMARGLEKNFFGAVSRYSTRRLAGQIAMAAILLPGPIIALLAPGSPGVRALGVAVAAVVIIDAIVLRVRTGRRMVPLLLTPAGYAILAAFLVRSAVVCLRNGGVAWRGTFYPLAELRKGMRVRM